MPKLEVTQRQFDEIELIVRRNPGGPEWIEESLTLIQNDTAYPIDSVVYVFFGPLANLLRWKRESRVEDNPNLDVFSIVHATQHHKLQGARAKTKRVYDIDGDKTWYWENHHKPEIQRTLEEMYQLESRYGRA